MQTADLNAKIQTLKANKDRWASMPISERISFLESAQRGSYAVAHRQVRAAWEAKRIDPNTPLAGEEYLAGPVVQVRTIRLLLNTLKAIAKDGRPRLLPNGTRTLKDGRAAVKVFPTDLADKLLLTGFEAEVWMQPGVTEANLYDHIAEFYRNPPATGRVSLVLGAGNVASIGPLDMIHKLFVEGQVSLLKLNPVNEYLGPFIEEAFGKLIAAGFVEVAYGGADVGDFLCQHPDIDEIHITGSDRTHDIIVFGPGEEGEARKSRGEPRNDKRITSELGNVSPVIVMPGSWTESEMRFQAENVATQLANNGGFNCNAVKVLILHEDWSLKHEFLAMLKAVLAAIPQRYAYYPGAAERYDRFVSQHENVEAIGPRTDDTLPWTMMLDVDATKTEQSCFGEEAFCGIVAQTVLPGADASEYLKNAVKFCNEHVWGTLNAGIIIDPRTEKFLGDVVEQAIDDLKVGSVAINHWAGLCYGFGSTAWGGYPGQPLNDVQSGIGAVHNTFLFDKPQKTVLRGPFVAAPKPPWFVTHGRTHKVAPRILEMEMKPSLTKIPGIAFHAFRGS